MGGAEAGRPIEAEGMLTTRAAARRGGWRAKSASANVGAVSLAGMCKELEITGRNGAVAGAAAVLPALERELDRVHCALQAELARAAGR
jgi:HPt (histidine-containing phosphotransfer) domain-containing protein